ncbi:ATPase, T2SS/T4P/T4SS family [Limnobacter humi]|uniref:ATPase, T2SS/T4P/T4SS family n=1 Tax=Limnobacter humi TaxID=1778671 RepID=A0ABT1WJ77_9BURK|nr:ATPase, T2SS/T4P/T4SS family [Limnobacter humi]MCQ8897571.1 ATPase, T2SS/T4P/T4SS family [Limnobacter humi]
MIRNPQIKLGESDLSDAGLDPAQLNLLRQQHVHMRSEGRSAELSALALRARFINLDDLADRDDFRHTSAEISMAIEGTLPMDVCQRFGCMPVDLSKGQLTLKTCQPLNARQVDQLRQLVRVPIKNLRLLPASRVEVMGLIQAAQQSSSVSGLIEALRTEGLEAGRLRALVYAVLREALTLRASDIHLNRKPDPDAWLAYRVDSVMRPTHLLPELLMQSLVARIKIEAGMDASNSRTAQDGRLSVEHDGRVVDFRISTQPLVDGESVVMRALDPAMLPSLQALFPSQPRILALMRSITGQHGKSGGLVFISGATGSGKSTTQYTMACGFRRDSMNLITVEDPVEYLLPFAKQIQLQALIRQKAIELERSILRQDPDILIFGEIRDADSARAALAFAESGHLVISTIHANSAVQVTERFMSIIDPVHREDAEFLMANYLRLVIHQRLLPRLCSCAVPCDPPELDRLNHRLAKCTGGLLREFGSLQKTMGCGLCGGTGYRGRVAAHETMHVPMDDAPRSSFVKAFRDGRVELPADLNPDNGIEFISRIDTLRGLLSQGLIDAATVFNLLEGA